MTSSKITTKKINYCSNCGKYGHSSKKCTDPITSLGKVKRRNFELCGPARKK